MMASNIPEEGAESDSEASSDSEPESAAEDRDAFSPLWDCVAFASTHVKWKGGDEHPLSAGPYLRRRQFWHVAAVSIVMSAI